MLCVSSGKLQCNSCGIEVNVAVICCVVVKPPERCDIYQLLRESLILMRIDYCDMESVYWITAIVLYVQQ